MSQSHRSFKYEYEHYSRKFAENSEFLYYITTRGDVYRVKKARKRRFQNYRHREPLFPWFRNGIKYIDVMGVDYQLKELSIKLFSWDSYDPKTQEIIHIDGNTDNCYITNLKIIERNQK